MSERLEQRILIDALNKTSTTQSQASALSGVSRPNISSYVSGARRPSLHTLHRLLSAMELDAEITMTRIGAGPLRCVRLSQLAHEISPNTVLDDLRTPLRVFGLRIEAHLV